MNEVSKREVLIDLEIKRAKLQIEVLEKESANQTMWGMILQEKLRERGYEITDVEQ